MKTFDELIEHHKASRKELQLQGKEALKQMFEEFFNDYPEFEAIRWAQYTPYFDDGDPCYFSVYDLNITKGSINDDWEDAWSLRNLPEGQALKEIETKLQSKEGTIMLEEVFGDHAEVTILAQRKLSIDITVNEYSHN